MVFAVQVILLGSMLLSSAYAAEQSVARSTAQSQAQEKVAAVQEPSAGQKARTLRKKAHKPAGVEKAEPKTMGKQDGAAETPIESSQSVQLRGVRG